MDGASGRRGKGSGGGCKGFGSGGVSGRGTGKFRNVVFLSLLTRCGVGGVPTGAGLVDGGVDQVGWWVAWWKGGVRGLRFRGGRW